MSKTDPQTYLALDRPILHFGSPLSAYPKPAPEATEIVPDGD